VEGFVFDSILEIGSPLVLGASGTFELFANAFRVACVFGWEGAFLFGAGGKPDTGTLLMLPVDLMEEGGLVIAKGLNGFVSG
jgi:hypothetical protein